MTNIEMKIMQKYDDFNQTEKKIADYFLTNREKVFHVPISNLAESSDVSQAAWVRFSKLLGFSGLKDLKKALFDEYNSNLNQSPVEFTDIKDYADLESLSKAVYSSSIQAITDTFQAVDAHIFDAVVNKLIEADTVRLFGVGASANVADDFATKLMRIGKHVCFHYDTHFQLSYAANTNPNDIAVFFSYTGKTVEVLECLDIVKAVGACTVSVTRLESNPLSKKADFKLYTASPELHYRSGAMSSRLAQLFVVDMLYTAIANRNYDYVASRLQKSHESCSTHRIP